MREDRLGPCQHKILERRNHTLFPIRESSQAIGRSTTSIIKVTTTTRRNTSQVCYLGDITLFLMILCKFKKLIKLIIIIKFINNLLSFC